MITDPHDWSDPVDPALGTTAPSSAGSAGSACPWLDVLAIALTVCALGGLVLLATWVLVTLR